MTIIEVSGKLGKKKQATNEEHEAIELSIYLSESFEAQGKAQSSVATTEHPRLSLFSLSPSPSQKLAV